jgi:tRNA(Ile)-lysidine synthase
MDIGETAAAPIGRDEFACLMAAVGPFEETPRLAIGCSGGADSMALTLLLHDWATAQGGTVTALTVDHRLRPNSTAEAHRVSAWIQDRNIPHEILTRSETSVDGNLQAVARTARYDLMSRWCIGHGVLHLGLAHHCEDQAETVLLRLARGSGVDGLSAMAPVVETASVRLIRPLLDMSKARLRATLAATGAPHVEDPSNDNPSFARVRFRQAAPMLAKEGLTVKRLCDTARRMARARQALDRAAADLLARAATLHAEGYGYLDRVTLCAAPEEVALRALARMLGCIGGTPYPPRLERLERLYAALIGPIGLQGARTLLGCRIAPVHDQVLICREPRAAKDTLPATGNLLWDGRFRLTVDGDPRFELRRLGRKGWAEIVKASPEMRKTAIPAAVRPSLPTFWHLDVVASVPHLSYVYRGTEFVPPRVRELRFAPVRPLSSARFAEADSAANT